MTARTRRNLIEGLLFASPWIIGFLTFTFGPVIASFVLSFYKWDVLTPPGFVGVGNHRYALARDSLFQGEAFRRSLGIVEKLRSIARRDGRTVAQLALAWTLANPAVTSAIVGAKRPSHIEQAAAASDYRLSADDLRQIEGVLKGCKGPREETRYTSSQA
jgi:ABC-type sugar transport system permease subunit